MKRQAAFAAFDAGGARMSILALASLGGLISALATSLGATASHFFSRQATSSRWSLSIDFALGVMVSASAFSLIGPAALDANASGLSGQVILASAAAGAILVFFLGKRIQALHAYHALPGARSSHLLLAMVLMLHNFPEGLASGAALGGLDWGRALPIIAGISIQNVPEGALMVLCLRTLGSSNGVAFLGGIGSGLVELAGGVLAGLLLESVQGALPVLLALAGGAMISSVALELLAGEKTAFARISSAQFVSGFALLALMQLLQVLQLGSLLGP
jgi:ZIP family zinc transporter